jgi:uracil-DNA glycosylase family 4
MSDSGYLSLLDAAIRHVETLKQEGVRYLPVSTSTLQGAVGTSQDIMPLKAGVMQNPAPSVPSTLPPSVPNDLKPPQDAVPPAAPAIVPMKPSATPVPVPAASRELFATARSAAMSREEKEAAMAELRQRALVCVKCENLASARTNVVFGVGDIHSSLMFVGEAPGADEDIAGEPFVGKAGQLLTKIIQTMGLSRQTVYIANILKCRPDTPGQTAGNRKPTPTEMTTCLPYLLRQIELIRPRVIVALGATAMEGLLGKSLGITKMRGKWLTFQDTPLMPTYHPAYLLRNQSLSIKREVWEDMLKVMEKLRMPISERQSGFFLKPESRA